MTESTRPMFSTKIPGQKNELTKIEKNYLYDSFGDSYQILEQIGVSGKYTSCYKLKNNKGESFVLKIQNKQSYFNWCDIQVIGEKSRSYHLYNYTGDVILPEIVEIGFDYVIETHCGEPLNNQMYFHGLSDIEKNKIATDISHLFISMHQESIEKNTKTPTLFQKEHGRLSISDIQYFCTPLLSVDENKNLNTLIQEYNNRNHDDEFTVFTHGNLTPKNILYCPNRKKISIISWNKEDKRNIYRDFVSFSPSSYTSDLLHRTALFYNQINKETNFKIDFNKMRLFKMLAIYHEIAYHICHLQKNGIPLHKNAPQYINKHINLTRKNILLQHQKIKD